MLYSIALFHIEDNAVEQLSNWRKEKTYSVRNFDKKLRFNPPIPSTSQILPKSLHLLKTLNLLISLHHFPMGANFRIKPSDSNTSSHPRNSPYFSVISNSPKPHSISGFINRLLPPSNHLLCPSTSTLLPLVTVYRCGHQPMNTLRFQVTQTVQNNP